MEDIFNSLQNWIKVSFSFSIHTLIRYSKENNLSVSKLGAMLMINQQHKRFAISSIGSKIGISTAAASQMFDDLVQQGYIDRVEAKNDRRIKNLLLTEKGKKVAQDLFKAREQWLKNIVKNLKPDEIELTKQVLDRLIKNAKDFTE